MPTSLFIAPIGEITADDVKEFLEHGDPENERLEYKEADRDKIIPESLVEVVCAFANTYGGLLILGVKADEKNCPILPADGLPLFKDSKPIRSLEERITSRCFDSIVPPLAPEVQVCRFPSPGSPTEDRAFIVVRVQPSPAIPHAVIPSNRVFVRVGSECRNADLVRLRFLFERERQREQLVEQKRQYVWKGHLSTRKRFEKFEGGPWKPGPYRLYLALIPLDAATDLLPFESTLSDGGFLDQHIRSKMIALIKHRAGMMHRLDDTLPLQRGLGLLGRLYHAPLTESNPASALYFDRSGGVAVDLAVSGFGYFENQEASHNMDTIAFLLWVAIAQLADLTCVLLRERGYGGRIEASIWSTTDLGETAPGQQEQEHYGETIFSVLDAKQRRSERLGLMLNMMIRTWLKYSLKVEERVKMYPSDFIQETPL